jgi:hypothetical protein
MITAPVSEGFEATASKLAADTRPDGSRSIVAKEAPALAIAGSNDLRDDRAALPLRHIGWRFIWYDRYISVRAWATPDPCQLIRNWLPTPPSQWMPQRPAFPQPVS